MAKGDKRRVRKVTRADKGKKSKIGSLSDAAAEVLGGIHLPNFHLRNAIKFFETWRGTKKRYIRVDGERIYIDGPMHGLNGEIILDSDGIVKEFGLEVINSWLKIEKRKNNLLKLIIFVARKLIKDGKVSPEIMKEVLAISQKEINTIRDQSKDFPPFKEMIAGQLGRETAERILGPESF